MAKQMVRPVEANVRVTTQGGPAEAPERGTGIKVQCEVPRELHERMRLELMLRQRRGAPATMERLVLDTLTRAQHDWPRPVEEGGEGEEN